jgi:hypothetical protein
MAEVSVEGRQGWVLADDVNIIRKAGFEDEVRLLPFFDHYLLTHHTGREHLVALEHKPKVFRVAGWVSPVVLIRGRVAGIWDLSKEVVTLTEFRPLSAQERRGVAHEVELLGQFLGTGVKLGR